MKWISALACAAFVALLSLRADAAKLTLTAPTARQVVQRNDENKGRIYIQGSVDEKATHIEARAVLMTGGKGEATAWRKIAGKDDLKDGGAFGASLEVTAGGWYSIEVRAYADRRVIAESKVDKVGVGEVFIIAGQSNAANSGAVRQKPNDDRVSAWTGSAWQLADDPQPITSGGGGSPWPVLGDLLVGKLQVPVGFVTTAWGGMSVAQWQPKGGVYARLQHGLQDMGRGGARAVLWHQGETDTAGGTSADKYAELLGNIIKQSRIDAGYDIKWFVAGASWIGEKHKEKQAAVREGQKKVCDGTRTFEGPITDDMQAGFRAGDGVHMNDKGLKEHAQRWADVLMKTLFEKK